MSAELKLFDLHISSVGKDILKKKVISVQFDTLNEGMVDIHINHENMEWMLKPGKIIVTARVSALKETLLEEIKGATSVKDSQFHEGITTFFNCSGVASMKNNSLNIFAFPIITSKAELAEYDNVYFKNYLNQLNEIMQNHDK